MPLLNEQELVPNDPQPKTICFGIRPRFIGNNEIIMNAEMFVHEDTVKKYLGFNHGGTLIHLPITTETPLMLLHPYVVIDSLPQETRARLRILLQDEALKTKTESVQKQLVDNEMKPIYFAPLITLIGAISAVINFYVRAGTLNVSYSVIATVFTSALWICMVKYANGKVIDTSFMYDVCMTGSYVVVLMILESVKPMQLLGIAIAWIGVYIMQRG